MTADTNYYQIALAEYMQANPSTRRADDLMSDPEARAQILQRAQWLKDHPPSAKFLE